MTGARTGALVGASLLAVIVMFQLALVAGAPWGSATQGGYTEGALPSVGRVLAGASVVICVGFALGLLGRVGVGPLATHRRWATALAWACLAYSVLGALANAASQSPVERAIWTPMCIALVVCSAVVLRGSHRRRPKAK